MEAVLRDLLIVMEAVLSGFCVSVTIVGSNQFCKYCVMYILGGSSTIRESCVNKCTW